jgi:hypothetical protein
MKVFKILMLVLSSIVLINKIYAQKDYVITSKKDTIFCEIKSRGFMNPILQYKVNGKDKYTKVDSTIVEYYIADDSTDYVSKKDRIHKFEGFILRAKKAESTYMKWQALHVGVQWRVHVQLHRQVPAHQQQQLQQHPCAQVMAPLQIHIHLEVQICICPGLQMQVEAQAFSIMRAKITVTWY